MSGTMASILNAVRPGTSNKASNHLSVPATSPVAPMKYNAQFSTSAQFTNATSLLGKVAIVTGSSRSLGASIAICLGEHGANVIINHTSESGAAAAQSVVQTIRSQGRAGAIAVRADASTVEGGKMLIDEAMKTFGRVDILVLNSGLMGSGGLDEMDEGFFEGMMEANVKAPLFLVKKVAPMMPQGGRIIFFSSTLTHASTVQANSLVYLATKGAIEQASRVLAKDLGTRGITVNTISLGPIDTPLFREGKSQAVIDGIAKQSPGRRLGEPEDVGPLVAFLASPAAQWINGQNIRVDGGYVV